ncbi:hypothetical protein DFJ77DRAFT_547640 [Powellomyces hirtus]|nr:hypothetical protein DFJ77DRAFT_547640 [Powellomyces hirtus]
MGVTDKSAFHLFAEDGAPIPEFSPFGCRPAAIATPLSSSTIAVTPNIGLIIYVDDELVYASVFNRIGEYVEVDGHRTGSNQRQHLEFGFGKNSKVVPCNGDTVLFSGTVRMEIWKLELIQMLEGVEAVWPENKIGQKSIVALPHANIPTPDPRHIISDTISDNTASAPVGTRSTALGRKVGDVPIVTQTIIYGPLPDMFIQILRVPEHRPAPLAPCANPQVEGSKSRQDPCKSSNNLCTDCRGTFVASTCHKLLVRASQVHQDLSYRKRQRSIDSDDLDEAAPRQLKRAMKERTTLARSRPVRSLSTTNAEVVVANM